MGKLYGRATRSSVKVEGKVSIYKHCIGRGHAELTIICTRAGVVLVEMLLKFCGQVGSSIVGGRKSLRHISLGTQLARAMAYRASEPLQNAHAGAADPS